MPVHTFKSRFTTNFEYIKANSAKTNNFTVLYLGGENLKVLRAIVWKKAWALRGLKWPDMAQILKIMPNLILMFGKAKCLK